MVSMSTKKITHLAYLYLDEPEHPDWQGLTDALIKHGLNLHQTGEILMSIRDGGY